MCIENRDVKRDGKSNISGWEQATLWFHIGHDGQQTRMIYVQKI